MIELIYKNIFPSMSICLNIASVLMYTYQGRFALSGYWVAAAWLTFTVTFLIKK